MNDKVDPKLVGERILKIRTALGLTLDEFADAIDGTTTKGTVSNWEHGRNLPNKARLARIAEIGGYSPDALTTIQPIDTSKAVKQLQNRPKQDINKKLKELIEKVDYYKAGEDEKLSLLLFLELLQKYPEKLYPEVHSKLFDFLFDLSQRNRAVLNTADNLAQMYFATRSAEEFIDTFFMSEPSDKPPYNQPFESYK